MEHYISAESGQVKQCARDLSPSSSSVKVTQGLTLRETPLFKICLSVSGGTINDRTFFELKKHKYCFPTCHWWSVVQPMRGKHSIVCICKIPCCSVLLVSRGKVMTKARSPQEPKQCQKNQTMFPERQSCLRHPGFATSHRMGAKQNTCTQGCQQPESLNVVRFNKTLLSTRSY